MSDAIPSSLVERYAERLGDTLAAADALVARRGRRLLVWLRVALAAVGLGGLALVLVGMAPFPEVAAVVAVLAAMGSLSADGASPGSRRARGRRAMTGGEACGTGE